MEHLGTEADIEEKKLLFYTISNLQIYKKFYNTLFNMVRDNLQEMILSSPMQFTDAIDCHIQLNGWVFLDFAESKSREIMKDCGYFYHIYGCFSANNELKILPKARLPNKIHASKAISPIYLITQRQ